MLIGAMNHPRENVLGEIKWMAALGLDFIDLTLEPPAASSWLVNPRDVRQALEDHGMQVVGHTAYYLPFASPFEEIRQASVAECKRCLEVFAQIGAKWMNFHPDRHIPMHERPFWIQRNLQTLGELRETSRRVGVGIMIENLPGVFNTPAELAELLDPMPELGLHLDIGHANLQVPHNTTEEILARFPRRLAHVHLHDNNGGDRDLHLPLGVGRMEWVRHVAAVKRSGYDGTITLEVFAPDRTYLKMSRDLLRRAWDEAA
ncbi:MAG TPA: sugar phosphate isomerase/epimerase family protein [Phycisphaerae bacterium]|nr:sugar phosphate isomerase/epimerase family protein [Phycisphaerae bacterium]